MDQIRYPQLVGGLDKRWIWKDEMGKNRYFLSCNYQERINNCITDLNTEIANLSELSMKDVVYMIVLIDWLSDAVYEIRQLLSKKVKEKIEVKNADDADKSGKYFEAIRSFIVAHPLTTNRHKDYKLTGNLICADVRSRLSGVERAFQNSFEWFYLGIDGLEKSTREMNSDFFLLIYNKKRDGGRFYQYVHMKLDDLIAVVNLRIKKLEDLDKQLSKLKKKDIETED